MKNRFMKITIWFLLFALCTAAGFADSQTLIDSYHVNIYEPATAIPMAPTIIADGMIEVSDVHPATVLLRITQQDGTLYTHDAHNALALLDTQIEAIAGYAMPMLQVEDASSAGLLRAYLAQKELSNAFVVSTDAALVQSVCSDNMYLRPVLDLSKADALQVSSICSTAFEHAITIVIIDEAFATQETLRQLQQRFLTVFVRTSADALSLHTQILSGANGIITENWQGAVAALESYTETTVVRPSFIIGHRGNYAEAPDNTLRSIASAAENGADIIEIDVRMTLDGVLVLCHNKIAPLAGRTQYTVAETEWSILSSMEIADARAESTDRLATLEDAFALVKENYPDVVLQLDLKDRRIEVIQAIRALAKEYSMLSNIALLTSSMDFNAQALALPMGCAVINSDSKSGAVRAGSAGESAYLVEKNYRKAGGYLCQEYLYFSTDLIEHMKHLGVTSWIYTLDKARDMDNRFLQGYAGMTTNLPAHGKSYARSLQLTGEGSEKRALLSFYDGSTQDVTQNCEETLLADGVYAMRYTITLSNKKTYNIYSLPYAKY